jgi:hypothetical protein
MSVFVGNQPAFMTGRRGSRNQNSSSQMIQEERLPNPKAITKGFYKPDGTPGKRYPTGASFTEQPRRGYQEEILVNRESE